MRFTGQARFGDADPVPATIELTEDALQIIAEGSAAIHLPLVDIDDVHDDDHVLRLADHTGGTYELSMLGRAYGQLVADLRARRDDALERGLLLRGVGLRDTFPGKMFVDRETVPVRLRVFEDLIVVLPERGRMFGVPYSFIDEVGWDEESYRISVVTDEGRTLVFGHLALRSEEFRDEVRRLMGELAARTAVTLSELLPGTPPATLSGLANLMRDGRAVQRRRLDEIDPSVWPRLEAAAAVTEDRSEAYRGLAAMTVPGWAAFGVKAVRPEGGEGAEDTSGHEVERERRADLWYFCPLSSDGRPINVVAQEVVSESGNATYLFRLLPPERFDPLQGDALADEVGRAVARLNRALLLLNFKRDPIRLPEEQLREPAHARYLVALRHLEYLRWARGAFLGRAIHGSSWEKQVADVVAAPSERMTPHPATQEGP